MNCSLLLPPDYVDPLYLYFMNDLHYQLSSNNKPVLLLMHGFLGSMHQWRHLEAYWSKEYRILKIDLPGHGNTSGYDKAFTLEDLAMDVNRILEKEKIEKVNWVGHSMGGYVGCAFAKARPQKLKSLHLLNSLASEDTEERKEQRNRSIALISKYPEAFINMAVSNLFTENERKKHAASIAVMKDHAQSIPLKSILHSIVAMRDRKSFVNSLRGSLFPVTYISGYKDQITAHKRIEREAFRLGANFYEIDSGHMSLLTSSMKLTEIMHFVE